MKTVVGESHSKLRVLEHIPCVKHGNGIPMGKWTFSMGKSSINEKNPLPCLITDGIFKMLGCRSQKVLVSSRAGASKRNYETASPRMAKESGTMFSIHFLPSGNLSGGVI